MNDGVQVLMEGWSGRDYAYASTVGAISMLVWARYYVSGGEAEVNRLYARHWEYRDIRLRVLLTLRRMENAQAAEIAKVLGISRQLASYHLRCLEKAGRVRRHGATYRVVTGRR